MRSDDVVRERFRATKFEVGYDQREVDVFLDEVKTSLERLEQGASITETPVDAKTVEEVRFTQTRYREGYSPKEVDELLDRLQHVFMQHEQSINDHS